MKYQKYVGIPSFNKLNPKERRYFTNTPVYQELKKAGTTICIAENNKFPRIYTKDGYVDDEFQIAVKSLIDMLFPAQFFHCLSHGYHFYLKVLLDKASYNATFTGLDVRLSDESYAIYSDKIKIFKDCKIRPATLMAIIVFREIDEIEDYIKKQKHCAKVNNLNGFIYKTDLADTSDAPLYFKA